MDTAQQVSGREASRADLFTSWVTPHLPAVARLAARLCPSADCDDVVQEALTNAWRKWDSYRPDRGSPAAWLLAIVADQSRKHRRKRSGNAVLDNDDVHIDAPQDVDLERAVRSLPRRQRLAIELHYFLDLPIDEVAAAMHCAPGTVSKISGGDSPRSRRSA